MADLIGANREPAADQNTLPMYSGTADVRLDEENTAYHSDSDYESCSRAKVLLDSPTLYYQRFIAKTLPGPSSTALEHGTLLHRWLEDGQAFLDLLVSPPPQVLTPTGQVGKDAEKWALNEAPPGSVVVPPKERAQILAEVAAVEAHPAAAELIGAGRWHEVSVRWQEGNYRLKCRADLITSDHTWVDLKTTRDTSILKQWWRSVLDYRYHLQDAWYRRGMEACGTEAAPLRFIVVSTSPPHDVQVVTLPAAIVAEGRRLMDQALAELALRRSLDWWMPDHHGEVVELEFPAWAGRSA